MDWATMFGTVGASGMFLPSQLCSLTSSLVSVPTDPLWTPWSGRAAAGRERLSKQLLQGGQKTAAATHWRPNLPRPLHPPCHTPEQ